MKKKRLLILILMVLLIYQVIDNNRLHVERIDLSRDLGKKIVLVSDVHTKTFGGRLLRKIKEENPDYILLTGDVISKDSDVEEFPMKFLEEVSKVAKTYFISGNHEVENKEGALFLKALSELPIVNLNDTYQKEGDILFMGLDNYHSDEAFYRALEELKEKVEDEEGLRVLLAHRPERFDAYRELGAELIFSGHTHGGQIRLPLIGSLVAPNQGFFPKYDKGIFT